MSDDADGAPSRVGVLGGGSDGRRHRARVPARRRRGRRRRARRADSGCRAPPASATACVRAVERGATDAHARRARSSVRDARTDAAAFAGCDARGRGGPRGSRAEDRGARPRRGAMPSTARCSRRTRRPSRSTTSPPSLRAPRPVPRAALLQPGARVRRSSRSWPARRPTPSSSTTPRAVGRGARQDADRRARLARLRLEPARRRARPRGDPDARGGRRERRRHRRRDGRSATGIRSARCARPTSSGSTCASESPRSCTRELGDRFEPPALLRRMVAEGKLGRKSGEGFYEWENDR